MSLAALKSIPDLAQCIHDALAAAGELDEQAREQRRRAGRYLATARAQHANKGAFQSWLRANGFDPRTAELLMQLHAGGVPR